VAFGLGIDRGDFENGITPEVRRLIAVPDTRSARQKARARRRSEFRRRLRRKYATPDVTALLRGHPPPKVPALLRVIADAARHGLVVTSTTGGGHAAGSYHYSGQAVDLGVIGSPFTAEAQRRYVTFQRKLARDPQRFRELIGPDVTKLIKNGRFTRYPSTTERAHRDHLHVAISGD
jgi:hypothetical protein